VNNNEYDALATIPRTNKPETGNGEAI